MKTHGESFPPTLDDPTLSGGGAADATLYRNIFGPVAPSDEFKGFQVSGQMDRPRTRVMLARLAKRMETPFRWPEPAPSGLGLHDNPNLPAGYTYLAQLVAHDLSNVTTILPVGRAGLDNTNVRRRRLVLETIYGGGPSESPSTYMREAMRDSLRIRLRMGDVRYLNGARVPPETRDIPRASCPHVAEVSAAGMTEVLIADPRNDNSIMLSQLTALFHLLHNGVLRKLPPPSHQQTSAGRFREHARQFQRAQHFVVGLYRRLILRDFLRRLLDRDIYDAYVAAGGPIADPEGATSGQILLEFSHAAYRMGHAMVRQSYLLNEQASIPLSVSDAIAFTSSVRSREMPLREDWVVQWSQFFELVKGTKPNLSRRLQPSCVASLLRSMIVPEFDESECPGLIYRDLARGASRKVRSVVSIIDLFKASSQIAIVTAKHTLLSDPAARALAIADWLREVPDMLSPDEIHHIAHDPPLGFFVLFEAAVLQSGLRLGPVGSAILAEQLFAELLGLNGLDPLDDLPDGETFAGLAGQICPNSIPDSFADLIELTAELNPELKTGHCKFI